jgi:SEC-C motif-containing protein
MKLIGQIEAITRKPGFIYTLAIILLRDLFYAPDDAADRNWNEHLNFQELTLLVGLLVKGSIDITVPTEEESANRFEDVYRLFDQLHKESHKYFLGELEAHIKSGKQFEKPEENYRRVMGAGPMVTEPIYYGGSGGYDFQYLDFAVDKYQQDATWIAQHIGISISDLSRIARDLKRLHEYRFNTQPDLRSKDFSEVCAAALSVFCFEEKDIQQFGNEAVKAFIKAFSLVPGNANAKLESLGQFNQLQANPIVQLMDGRYFVPIGFNLSEAIYESPFYWMNKDASYRGKALQHRGQFAEDVTANLLRKVFGTATVYKNIEIKQSKGLTVTDIDVLAIVGNKAVIAQVKSKRMTELAKSGDEGMLLADFKLAIQEAYDQSLLSRQAILGRGSKLFVEGKEIHLSESIDDAYVLCITLDHYPAVMHQLDAFLIKGSDDPFPVALSIFDLDILTFYLADPFEFAYYLRQRIMLSDYYKADSEMSLLGFHIKHKLFKKDKADWEMLDNSFAQLIDANYPVMRSSVPRTPAANKLFPKWRNEEFQRLVDEVKIAGEPGFTDAVFLLYDLAGNGADQLIDMLKVVKQKTVADGQTHDARMVFAEGASGTTILADRSPLVLEERLLPLAKMAKYKSKANTWLAFGCLAESDRLVDAMAFSKATWKYDPTLEELAKHFKGTPMRPSGKKIGRNEKCPCNSGKKFKYCHGTDIRK